jgi:hypothetical protein
MAGPAGLMTLVGAATPPGRLAAAIAAAAEMAQSADVAPPLSSAAKFAVDSLLEGTGFEPSVPRKRDNGFRDPFDLSGTPLPRERPELSGRTDSG